jgi:hypothetical protein
VSEVELNAMRALAECIGATGSALAKMAKVISDEFPHMQPRLLPIMNELLVELHAAALLLPDESY